MPLYSEMTREEALEAYLDRGMTVGQLRERLKRFDDNAKVLVAHTASDYWRSPIAENIDGVEETEVKFTDYHNCAQERNYERDETGDGLQTIVVLRI